MAPMLSYAQFSMSADIKTNHLWRGGEVADGIVIVSDATFTPFEEIHDNQTVALRFGVWGGINVQGTYKEFNYFVTYCRGGFSVTLADTYNFADYATYNNEEFFNYRPSSTGRFLDATLNYRISDAFPLTMRWATILFGRDRDSANTKNRYSTFCYMEYPIYDRGAWQLDAGVGGAFALNPQGERTNFYGTKPGIVEAKLVLSHDLHLGKYSMPLSLVMMWNPQSDKAYMQLAAELFSF